MLQGYELKKDFDPYMRDLQQKLQKTRTNFDDFSRILKKRMSEVQKQDEPVRTNAKGIREGYLFLLEKSKFDFFIQTFSLLYNFTVEND